MDSKSVLSIQSHVSHGYVGSRAATFTLQYQGWDVDNINTVNFSNHTGYGNFKGSPISAHDCESLFTGLNNIQILHSYDAVITGYIPNQELIKLIVDRVKSIKLNSTKSMLYLLDPVMGDQGYLYVDKSCINQYKQALFENVVDIITPNQFELELLWGQKIGNKLDLLTAIDYLHNTCNITYIIITSLDPSLDLFNDNSPDYIYCVCSTRNSSIKFFKIPVIESYFTGVGDLFSSLLLDKLHGNLQSKREHPLVVSVNQALTIMQNVLQLTHKSGLIQYCNSINVPYTEDIVLKSIINDGNSMKFFELKIIQSKKYFDYLGDGGFKPYDL